MVAQRTALALEVEVSVGVVDCAPEQRSLSGSLRPPGDDTHLRLGDSTENDVSRVS